MLNQRWHTPSCSCYLERVLNRQTERAKQNILASLTVAPWLKQGALAKGRSIGQDLVEGVPQAWSLVLSQSDSCVFADFPKALRFTVETSVHRKPRGIVTCSYDALPARKACAPAVRDDFRTRGTVRERTRADMLYLRTGQCTDHYATCVIQSS